MAKYLTAPRGTKDITPDEIYKWHFIESVAAKVAAEYGFRETRFPTFEHTELFIRGVGDTTDVVQKEMYTFTDKGGRSITLRPEGTAGAVRSYIENSLFSGGLPVKLYYLASIFRYDKPQAGRYREHHQFGVECIGTQEANADAEVICLAGSYLKRLGITAARLEINSIGCNDCRPAFHSALREYLSVRKHMLCPTCLERLDKNPLRVLDCKNDSCCEAVIEAPVGLEFLCNSCDTHFNKLTQYLRHTGIEYTINPRIVRGLDYYTKTVFEYVSAKNGLSLVGGGRYDELVSALGGQSAPALGFGSGIERVLLELELEGVDIKKPVAADIFVAAADGYADMEVQSLVYQLRTAGVKAERDIMGRSLKSQMKYADKLGVEYSLVIGTDEINKGSGELKNMKTGEKQLCPLDVSEIAKVLAGSTAIKELRKG